ncbi:MAG: helix-turn-helix transcriptional regulator, partial [Lachnospiraceae bacterium]|nr:helix-turn-helix transcriptional regulator [Lachnospiraceae bacterium]
MKYIEYKEQRSHGTRTFPFAYYYETISHPRYNMIYHWHTEFEIIHVISGEFSLSCDGEGILLGEDECAFIPSGSLHGGVPEDCIYECLVFDLQPLLKASPACAKILNNVYEHQITIDKHFLSDSFFTGYCRKIMTLMREKTDYYEFFVQGLLLSLFGEIFSNNCYSATNDTNNRSIKKLKMFKKTLGYIEEHYSEDLSLDNLADICNMNSNYFCRAFKELTGKTPMEYLNYYRIESACELIATTGMTLIDIAMNCGFNDYSYFIKVFKKY